MFVRPIMFSLFLLIASPSLSARIEGSEANMIVRNGSIIASGIKNHLAAWQLLIKYRRNLYSCFVVFNDDGMEVRWCWAE